MAEPEITPTMIKDDRIRVPDRNVSGAPDSNVEFIQNLLIQNDYLEEGQSDGYFGDISAAALAAYNEDEKIKFDARMNPNGNRQIGTPGGPDDGAVPDPKIAELQGLLDASIANANTLKTTADTLRTTLSESNKKLFDKTALLESDIKGSKAIIADTLALYGLPASLAKTLNDALVGGESGTAIAMQIRDTDEYRARFPAMAQRRELNLPAVSEADYLNLERNFRTIMQAAKLPSTFHDAPEDFDQLISGDVSPQEFQERVTLAEVARDSASTETRRLLNEFYDISEGDLTAYYLDPTRAETIFEDRRRMESAGLAAASRQTIGQDLTVGTAEALQAESIQRREIQQRLGQRVGLTDQLLGEEEALTASTIAEAEFGLDVESATRMRRRREERTTGFAGRSGALTTAGGVTSLGEAT